MKRLIKQLIFGAIYLTIFSVVFLVFYLIAIKPSPTCSDLKQNGSETGVDCGGPSCVACAVKALAPIKVLPVKIMPTPDKSKVTALLQFQNQNLTYAADKFLYALKFYDARGNVVFSTKQETFIYAGEIKYNILPALAVSYASVYRGEAEIESVSWVKRDNYLSPQTQFRGVRFEKDSEQGRVVISGILKNDNAFALSGAAINAILISDIGVPAAASKTVLAKMAPFEERTFQIFIAVNPDILDFLSEPKITVEAER